MYLLTIIPNVSNGVQARGIHKFTQGGGAFDLVACSYNFQGRIREWGMIANETKCNMTKTLRHYLICDWKTTMLHSPRASLTAVSHVYWCYSCTSLSQKNCPITLLLLTANCNKLASHSTNVGCVCLWVWIQVNLSLNSPETIRLFFFPLQLQSTLQNINTQQWRSPPRIAAAVRLINGREYKSPSWIPNIQM